MKNKKKNNKNPFYTPATEYTNYTDAIYFLERNCLDYSATELYYSDNPDVRGALNKLWEVKNRYVELRAQNRKLKQELWALTHPDCESDIEGDEDLDV